MAGHLHLPQRQRWRDLDKHLALDALSEYCLRDRVPTRHHDVAVAEISSRTRVLRKWGWQAWPG